MTSIALTTHIRSVSDTLVTYSVVPYTYINGELRAPVSKMYFYQKSSHEGNNSVIGSFFSLHRLITPHNESGLTGSITAITGTAPVRGDASSGHKTRPINCQR